jgi:hypothetical protein
VVPSTTTAARASSGTGTATTNMSR